MRSPVQGSLKNEGVATLQRIKRNLKKRRAKQRGLKPFIVAGTADAEAGAGRRRQLGVGSFGK